MSSRAQVVGTEVMGVVNVTPDSFSDGGQWLEPEVAIAHARHMLDQGADILDIGGESTRPGAARVPEAVELERVMPVVTALVGDGARVSVDTMRATVAEQALDAGAWCINDVSGGLADPAMVDLVAERGCEYVVNHWRGPSDVMNEMATYDDVVADVHRELMERVEALTAAGVDESRIILDPGLGFAKDAHANWQLLAGLDTLLGTGFRVLVGASRKRFLGDLLARDGVPLLPMYRDRATAAVSALAAARGVWAVRVHDVPGSVDAVRVATAWRAAEAELRQGSTTIGTGEIA
ncbi:MAG TPA: dihydropteroate synthase [Actinotalea caeni]|uniref:dihydropteroate synthase n=2 Tax=Actinotalea caeni TaxID=1348467 RepID=UPI002B4AE878|nr:dihydropteroate synthase [Actinotalea caeni]HLV54472.1 dihydropteroate synthase [Actinotalea caeni]